jgi:hypothetical protein
MNQVALLDKLVEIECAIGVETDAALHELIIEAQNHVFRMQRETAANLRKSPGQQGFMEMPIAS